MEKSTVFCIFISLAVVFLLSQVALAHDPTMLQDVCVRDSNSTIKVDGYTCKQTFTEDDFFSTRLVQPGNTSNIFGSSVIVANVERFPGLNTLGVAMSRIDFAPGGLNPPHTHPRATEIAFVLYGTLDVGFITTANRLVSKTITEGELFIFPRGTLHFQINNGEVPAAVIAGFDSQLPGTLFAANALFNSTPSVPDNVLSKTFQIETKEVEIIKSHFAPNTS